MSEITIKHVAEEAGLSISSVSRILRGGQGHAYPSETHERVREIAQRLGYQANIAARLLSQNTRTMIGMSVHFTEHPYLNRFLVAVQQELLKQGYDPVFMDSQRLSGEGSSQPFPPPHMLAGLISLGIDLQQGWPEHYAALHHRIPIVAVQPVAAAAAEHIDVIRTDFTSAYLLALKHLAQLGHQHIAYLGMLKKPNPSDSCKNRGWNEAVKLHGLPADYRIHWSGGDAKAPRRATQTLEPNDFIYDSEIHRTMMDVVEHLDAFPHRVTALICGSDEVAIALQSYLQSQGRHLPRDLSVVGYDGISLGEYVYPALTTIAPDYNKMAEVAVSRLLYLITNGNSTEREEPVTLLIKPNLVVRASTARPLPD